MFVHIGNDNVIRSRDIITIVEHDVITSSTIMGEMVDGQQAKGNVIGPEEDAKSVVITIDYIYYSTLSVPTLKKRSSMTSMINKIDESNRYY